MKFFWKIYWLKKGKSEKKRKRRKENEKEKWRKGFVLHIYETKYICK